MAETITDPVVMEAASTEQTEKEPNVDIPREATKADMPPATEPSTMELDDNAANQAPPEDIQEDTPVVEQGIPSAVEEELTATDGVSTEEFVRTIEAELEETENTVKDSTSSAVGEFSEMSEKDPVSAFKFLISSPTSSTTLATSSSTTSLTSKNQETAEELLQQLKTKVLEENLLAKIRTNPIECFAIKELVRKLRKSKPNEELLTFLLEFNSIFETLAIEIKHHGEALKQKEHAQEVNQKELESLQATETELNSLEAQVAKNAKATADLNAKIQGYKDEIKELQLKLESAERERDLLQEKMVDPEAKLRAEALKGLERLDSVNQQKATIARLDEELEELEASISASTKIFNRLKDTLRNIQ